MHTDYPKATVRTTALLPLLLLMLGYLTSCKPNDDNTPTVSTINDLIVNGNGSVGNRFTLLNAALQRAGLSGTLGQAGTYTLFAPTDDAFKAAGYTDANAISALSVAQLQAVLQYHVLATRLDASSIPTGFNTAQTTAAGSSVYLSKGTLTTTTSTTGTSTTATSTTATSTTATVFSVNGARILTSGTNASNGIIYPIDRLLLPPAFGDIAATIQGIPTLRPTLSFTFLNAAVARAGILSALTSTTAPVTVFAPTDAAFTAAVPSIRSVADVSAMPVDSLRKILTYHVVPGRVYSPLITAGSSLTTAQGARSRLARALPP
nr:fasciclin domain-containing protein [Spirosoma rhododendri]